ncbi:MAG: hypothetical protein HY951_00645 [Bacteroidia bacterium]|nr:hypothetical protein [Bacteroidia bacterium]
MKTSNKNTKRFNPIAHLAHLQVAQANAQPKPAKELNLACPHASLVVLFFVLTNLFSVDTFAQIQSPNIPTFEKQPNPISNTQSYSTGQTQQDYSTLNHSDLQTKKVNANVPDNIYNSLNKNNFVLTSNSTIPGKTSSSVDNVYSIINEMKNYEPSINYHFPSLQSATGFNSFNSAYQELLDMLEGRKTLDLKRAVFITENAFFGNQMKYEDYKKSIAEMALLIQLKMQQEKLSVSNNDAILYMTHQYFTDTLNIKLRVQEKTVTTFPKTYDFQDPFGNEDPTKMFVSKLMVKNSGQCKSLPLLFLILVNELGGNAYLSFSPSHSYIKSKDKNGVWYNIELTNGMLTSDSWVVGSGYIKSEAVKSGIFLDTLNKKEVIAQCLVDLAQYYTWHYKAQDDFVLKCVNKALEFHPNNIWAIQVKSDYYSYLFKYVSEQKGFSNIEQLKKDPKALELFTQRNRIYALIDGLGYQPMPEQAYIDWLKTLNEKQQKQESEQQYINFSKIVR